MPGSVELPLGELLAGWETPAFPSPSVLRGRHVQLQPIDIASHAHALFAAFAEDVDGRGWTYLSYGPFENFEAFDAWMRETCLGHDPLFYAVCDAAGVAAGLASYLRIAPTAGSIEIGHLHFAPRLRRTVATTEALSLMIGHAFELGYRRVEWKCNALNAASRASALRLGFSYEGTFRQAMLSKGRNRDTAWYAIIDREWLALAQEHARWLDADNFDEEGRQRMSLAALTAPLLHARG